MNRLFIALTAALLFSCGAFASPAFAGRVAPATSVEEKNAICLAGVASFGQDLVDTLNQGVPPETLRKAINGPNKEARALGEKLLDAILSRDEKQIEAAFTALVANCVALLTKKEQVEI